MSPVGAGTDVTENTCDHTQHRGLEAVDQSSSVNHPGSASSPITVYPELINFPMTIVILPSAPIKQTPAVC